MAHTPISKGPWLTVVETAPYLKRAAKLFTEGEREAVVQMVAQDPTCGRVLEGTGGVRKVRAALGGRGKSGGARVVYYFHSAVMPVFLLTVFAKNEKANLPAAERNGLARIVDAIKDQYGEGRG
jgi:hypothetical protein